MHTYVSDLLACASKKLQSAQCRLVINLPVAQFLKISELRKLLQDAKLPVAKSRSEMLAALVAAKLLTEEQAGAKSTRRRAPRMDVHRRAELAKVLIPEDADRPVVSVKSSLSSLLRHVADRSTVVGKIETAVRNVNRIVSHAYQLLKLKAIGDFDDGRQIDYSETACLGALYACSKEGAPDDPAHSDIASFFEQRYAPVASRELPDDDQDASFVASTSDSTHLDRLRAVAKLRDVLPSRRHLINVLCYEAREMSKNARVNVACHLSQHVRTWVNAAFEVKRLVSDQWRRDDIDADSKRSAVRALRARYEKIKHDLLHHDGEPTCDSEHLDFVTEARSVLWPPGRPLENGCVAYDVKVEATTLEYVAPMIEISRHIEALGAKGFHALPQRTSFVPSYIILDTVAVQDILADGTRQSELLSWDVKQSIWRRWFRVDTRRFRRGNRTAPRYVFKHILKTDGIAASIVLVRTDRRDDIKIRTRKKKKKKAKKPPRRKKGATTSGQHADVEQADHLAGDDGTAYPYVDGPPDALPDGAAQRRCVAIDPGTNDIVYAQSRVIAADGEVQVATLRYTRTRRRRETKWRRHRVIRSQLEAQGGFVWRGLTIGEVQTLVLGGASSRSATAMGAEEWIATRTAVETAMYDAYADGAYRRLRWHGYIMRRRSEDRFVRQFRDTYGGPDDVLIAFGDCSITTHTRGREPTIKGESQRAMFARNGYGRSLALVNEYRTTVGCSTCKQGDAVTFMTLDVNPKPWRQGKPWKVHGLLRCKSCGAHHNRNKNATTNQLRVAEAALAGVARPDDLS